MRMGRVMHLQPGGAVTVHGVGTRKILLATLLYMWQTLVFLSPILSIGASDLR
jgi:hypothetical protein